MAAIEIPPRSPRANAFAERFLLTVRTEVTDRVLIFGQRHLRAVQAEYARHYNGRRSPPRTTTAPAELRPPRPHQRADQAPGGPRRPYQRGTNRQHESPCQLRVTQVWHPTGHDVTPIVLDVAANGRPPEDLVLAADVPDPLTGSSSWACGPAAKTFAAPWRARHRRGDHATCERLVGAPAPRAPQPCPDPRRGAPARRPGRIPSAHNKARPHQDIAQRASPMANTTVATSPPPTSAANGSTENSSSTA